MTVARPLPDADLQEIAEGLAPVADALKSARVLIAGGSGFVGRWLAEGLLALDRARHLELNLVLMGLGMDRFQAACPHLAQDSRITFVEGALGGDLGLDAITGVTHLIHAASDVNRPMDAGQALRALDILDGGTEQLLQEARRWPLKRMLYVSSAAVYDRIPEDGWMSDESGKAPVPASTGVYSAGKRLGELRTVLHAPLDGYEAVVARLGAFAGPLLPLTGGFAVGNFLADALAGRPIILKGDGSPVRAYQYPTDMVVWMVTLLVQGRAGEAYNVGGDEPVDLKQLAGRIHSLAGGAGVEILGTPVPESQRDIYLPPVAKAKRELGLENRVSLDEALRRMVSWHRGQEA